MRQRRSPIEEFKIKANLLKKAVSSDDDLKKSESLHRFSVLPEFSGLSPDELKGRATRIKLKHALEVIALENGYPSWRELLAHEDISWYHQASPFILHWFAHYDEAKAHLKTNGGYLLAFRNQFFIGTADYIDFIGLDPMHPAWQKVGFDVVEPRDAAALREIRNQLRSVMKRRQSNG